MPRYVDGFVIPIPKKNVEAYRRISRKAGKIWMEHGALEYLECVGDDLAVKGILPFTELTKAKRGETVIFSWIVYKSKAHRDRVNAKVMKDPRMEEPACPFDIARMSFGGFKAIVDLQAE
jgi:uncharacterized protein YbaA (DUF1428 family)